MKSLSSGERSNPGIGERLEFNCDFALLNEIIAHEWNSMMFLSGTEIAFLKNDKFMVVLGIAGDTKILDKKKDVTYQRERIIENKELFDIIRSGKLDLNDRYKVIDNNWFCLSLYELGGIDLFIPFDATDEEREDLEEQERLYDNQYILQDDMAFDAGVENVFKLIEEMLSVIKHAK